MVVPLNAALASAEANCARPSRSSAAPSIGRSKRGSVTDRKYRLRTPRDEHALKVGGRAAGAVPAPEAGEESKPRSFTVEHTTMTYWCKQPKDGAPKELEKLPQTGRQARNADRRAGVAGRACGGGAEDEHAEHLHAARACVLEAASARKPRAARSLAACAAGGTRAPPPDQQARDEGGCSLNPNEKGLIGA